MTLHVEAAITSLSHQGGPGISIIWTEAPSDLLGADKSRGIVGCRRVSVVGAKNFRPGRVSTLFVNGELVVPLFECVSNKRKEARSKFSEVVGRRWGGPARVDSFSRSRPFRLRKANRVDIFGRRVFKAGLVNFEDSDVVAPFHPNFCIKVRMSDDVFHLENHVVLLIAEVLRGGPSFPFPTEDDDLTVVLKAPQVKVKGPNMCLREAILYPFLYL